MKQPKRAVIINSAPHELSHMARLPYNSEEERQALLEQASDWDEHLDDVQHGAVYFYKFKTSQREVLSRE